MDEAQSLEARENLIQDLVLLVRNTERLHSPMVQALAHSMQPATIAAMAMRVCGIAERNRRDRFGGERMSAEDLCEAAKRVVQYYTEEYAH